MLRQKSVFAIFMIVLVDILSFTVMIPFLPYYAQKFGATPLHVGLLLTAFALCQFLAGPTLGRLSDAYGRKPILLISQVGTFLGLVALALANSLWMVYFARIIDGITAGNISVAQAALSDETPVEKRTQVFGIIGIAFGLGFFVGPAVSGFLFQYGETLPIWMGAALSLLSILATIILLPSRKAPLMIQGAPFSFSTFLKVFDFHLIWSYLKNDQFRHLLIRFFLFSLSFSTIIAGFAMFAEGHYKFLNKPFGPQEVGYLWAYLGFMGILWQGWLLNVFVKKIGDDRLLFWGVLAQGIGYIGYFFSGDIVTLVVFSTLGSAGGNFNRPLLMAQASKIASPEEQGAILGVVQSLSAVASIISPIIGGLLLDDRSYLGWALFAGLSCLAILLVPQAKKAHAGR